MNILFISDLHLCEERPHITDIFLRFLKTKALEAKALYILGDFFESWVGDDDETELNNTVTEHLFQLSQHIPIYLMHGNRDFLIGKKFTKKSGCTLLKDPTIIDLHGEPTLLMHGDTLCTEDVEYQKFRVQARNPFYQTIFLSKSLEARKNIAKQLRQLSKESTSMAAESIMDVTPAEVLKIMQKHKVKQLIHGHTHRPGIEPLILENTPAKRIVLAPWENEGSMLICPPLGDYRFEALG